MIIAPAGIMRDSAQKAKYRGAILVDRAHMLWFNFILGLNFCFELIIIHNHSQKQKKEKNFNLG